MLSNESDGFSDGVLRQTEGTGTAGTGVIASVKNFFQSLASPDTREQEYYSRGISAGGALLAANVEDQRVEAVASLFEASGARDVSEPTSGATGGTTSAYSAGTERNAHGEVIPIIEEELHVGKREVQRGGVRVYSQIREIPVEEQVRLREEHVRVQRNPVNREASVADLESFKERTVELTEVAEEAVVAKQARVVEEVRIGKDVTERTETVRDKVRRTEVEVEDVPANATEKAKSAKQI